MLEIAHKAPDFKLLNQNKQEISLSKYLGNWVVLYFYPKDDTPGCTVEACDFTNEFKEFQKLDAVVLGCSADSCESHQKFIRKHNLSIDLLSDPERLVLESYDALGEKTMYGKKYLGILRSTFLINPNGEIVYIWKNVTAKGHVAIVKQKLIEMKK